MYGIWCFLVVILLNTLGLSSFEDTPEFKLQPITAENAAQLVKIAPPINAISGHLKTISHDGTLLVTQQGSSVTVWNFETGEEVFIISVKLDNYVDTVFVFSPNDNLLATNALGGLTIFDVQRGESRAFHEHGIVDIAFSPDGRLIASAKSYELICFECTDEEATALYAQNTVMIHLVETGELVQELWREESKYWGFSGIAFSPDGQLLATLGSQQSLFFWSVDALSDADIEPVSRVFVEQQGGDLAFTPDGSHLAVSYSLLHTGGDAFAALPLPVEASIWDVNQLFRIEAENDEMIELIGSYGSRWVAYSSDGSMVFTYGLDVSPSIWDAQTGENIIRFASENALLILPDSTMIITSNDGGSITYWGIPSQ